MANTWVPGYQGSATFESITYDITDWNLSDGITVLDGTSTGSGQLFIPVGGIKKATGSVKMNFDALKNPTQQASSAAVVPGQAGTLTLAQKTGKVITCAVMIANVNQTNNVNGLLTFEFTFEGTVTTYPTYA